MIDHLKKLLVLPPIVLAALGFVWLQAETPVIAQETAEAALPVRVIEVRAAPFALSVSGFGRAEAARTWSGVAEVEGRLTEYSDAIQVGALVSAGETVFAIDPRDFEIAVAQAEASVLSSKATLAELDVSEANQAAVLEAERNILALLEADRDRTARLVESGGVAQATLDDDNRSLLTQQSVVTNAEASLALYAPQRQSAEASLASAEADLENARRNLERAEVTAPFDGRVTERGASLQEYVRTGDVLLTIEDISYSEVAAAIQPGDLATLVSTLGDVSRQVQPEIGLTSTQVQDLLGRLLTARVVVQTGNGGSIDWPARLTRITGTIDQESGALGVVVAVDEAAFPDRETGRPPLVNGSFAEVVLTGPEMEDAILLPRDVVRRGDAGQHFVYVADSDDRLARQQITLGPVSGAQVLIMDGLAPGTRVLLSDVMPAAEGILLAPIPADAP